ncbi:hypothetical protein R1sor_020595 [Riccia sorocarpa]|uniref:Uncharacterized protein n=1 Tax=Riccia sorocarpa TaxID=122646 RepID=A0ABD3IFW4_9MARC
MVRDPGRAPSGLPPSQGGQPDRQERHRTHGTCADGVRPTLSTVSGGRPPTGHSRGSSRRGAGTTGAGSSGGKTPRVTAGTASGSSSTSSQTSIPVTVSAPTPSVFAPATSGRVSIGRGSGEGPSGEGPSRPTLAPIDVSHMFESGSNVAAFTREQMQEWMERFFTVKLQQFATEMGLGSTPSASGGGASTEQEDTTRRRRSRSSHEDETWPRSRRSRRTSPDGDGDRRPQPIPLVQIQMDLYGIPEGTDSLKVVGTMVREICRLYLPDDAVWSDVPMTTRYDMYRDIRTRPSTPGRHSPRAACKIKLRSSGLLREGKGVVASCFLGSTKYGGVERPYRFWFCPNNTCHRGPVVTACRSQVPPLPLILPVLRSTNLNHDEVDYLTQRGIVLVDAQVRGDCVLERFPTEAEIKVIVDAYPENVTQ